MQSASRSHEEVQRPPYEQQLGPRGIIVDSRSWGEVDAVQAPRAVLHMHASDGVHQPVRRESQGDDGDSPRAVTKRPKKEFVDAHRAAHVGPGQAGPLGEPQSSDDALSTLAESQYDRAPPHPTASLLQEPPVAVRASLSQSSEIGVAPRPREPELRAQWTVYDAASFTVPVSLSYMAAFENPALKFKLLCWDTHAVSAGLWFACHAARRLAGFGTLTLVAADTHDHIAADDEANAGGKPSAAYAAPVGPRDRPAR